MPWALLLNRYTVGAALLIASHAYVYHRGYSAADRAAELSEARAALAAAYQDLDAQRIAAEHARRAADENRQAADEAQERIDAYEQALQERGEDARCRLSDDDLRRLQPYGRPSGPAASPGR